MTVQGESLCLIMPLEVSVETEFVENNTQINDEKVATYKQSCRRI